MLISSARTEYEGWLVSSRDLSSHTAKAYREDLAIFQKHVGAKTNVADVTRESMIGFLGAQRQSGLAASSVRRRASSLRGFCKWLCDASYLETNPWDRLTLDLPVRRVLPRALSSSDLTKLLLHLRSLVELGDASSELRRPYNSATLLAVTLMVSTGMRVGELVSVHIEDVDLAGGSIRVLGKGRRERVVYIGSGWIKTLLSEQISWRKDRSIAHDVLLSNHIGLPLSTAAVRSRLRVVAKEAGLTRRVTPHMLRHTAATQLVESGVDIRFVQRLLGHASLSTTEIYTHVSDESLKRVVGAADVVGRALSANN
jgi:site-specific recombinase XerD